MDFFIQNGVNWVVAIQSLGTWLKVPMLAFSFLGTENFFLLVLPLIYWCIDARLGMQVGFILLTSTHVNSLCKLWFAGPRPYWVSSKVTPYLAEETFGIPSGHAQNSVAVWGMIASSMRKPWAWMVAVALMFFIGFSRLYLGVHFPHDVVAGWLLGSVLLWLFLRFWVPVEAWLKKKSLGAQVLIALLVSILFIGSGAVSVGRLAGYTFATEWQDNALRAGALPAPISLEEFITSAGTLFGLAAGVAWLAARGGYQVEGSVG
ncbi:MAG TPA: phosphatase PAP2 family protein, partial [Anaerolineales bacterium]|nr:phosphatase PAP2 family protein [Anaerolineales bacterium]